ncbi:MAG: cupin domain-containing protein [Flavobacteriales bacterium]|nr:cupin domain-containing protein [Flavobacteriales bacterium]
MTRHHMFGSGSKAFGLAVLLAMPAAVLGQGRDLPPGAIQVPAEDGVWQDAPATLPPGTRMLLLEGHPAREGFFTMRLRIPAGTRLAPHWHPRDERVTVLSGLVRVGFGDHVNEAEMATFGPGSFYLNPLHSHHYVWFMEDSELQLTGIGPWELHLVEH